MTPGQLLYKWEKEVRNLEGQVSFANQRGYTEAAREMAGRVFVYGTCINDFKETYPEVTPTPPNEDENE